MDRYFQKAEETASVFVGPPVEETGCKIFKLLVLLCRFYGGVTCQKWATGTNAKRPKKCRELYYYSWQDLSSFSFLSNLSLLYHTTFCMIKINNGKKINNGSHFPYTSKIATFYIGSSVCALQYLCKSIDK